MISKVGRQIPTLTLTFYTSKRGKIEAKKVDWKLKHSRLKLKVQRLKQKSKAEIESIKAETQE